MYLLLIFESSRARLLFLIAIIDFILELFAVRFGIPLNLKTQNLTFLAEFYSMKQP